MDGGGAETEEEAPDALHWNDERQVPSVGGGLCRRVANPGGCHRFLGLGHLRGPGVSLGRILGDPSIEPLFGGGGV